VLGGHLVVLLFAKGDSHFICDLIIDRSDVILVIYKFLFKMKLFKINKNDEKIVWVYLKTKGIMKV